VHDSVVGVLLVPHRPDGLAPTRTPLVVVVASAAPVPTGVPVGCTVVRDDTGQLAAAYCPAGVPTGGHLVVVRPDWHIAARRDLAGPADLGVLDALADRARGGDLPPSRSSATVDPGVD
jgi:hypothetical protein